MKKFKGYKREFSNKSVLLLMFGLFFLFPAQSQNMAKYWISFTNKEKSAYNINRPLEFLSKKSLDRRKKGKTYVTRDDLPVSNIYIDSIVSYGLKYLHSSRWFNGALFEVPDENIVTEIKKLGFVSSIEKRSNAIVQVKSKILKWLPDADSPVNLDASLDYGMGLSQNRMIHVDALHSKGFRGKNISIAIIDAGFTNYEKAEVFDSLILSGRILGYHDFVNPGNTNYNQNFHGSIVLGTMGANIPGFYVGGAPDASYLLLRSEDASTEFPAEEDNWIAAIEFADSAGVDLVNTSLGYFDFDDSTYNHTLAQLNGHTLRISIAAEMAAQRGMLLTISAGNSGRSEIPYIGAPADALGVLTVGAVNKNEQLTAFSSRGIGPAIKPDIVTQGAGIPSLRDSSWYPDAASGTSFSSPIAGAASACLLQAFPNESVEHIINAIKNTANHSNAPDLFYGYGIPDFEAAYNYLLDPSNQENQGFAYPTLVDNFLMIEPQFSKEGITIIEIFSLSGQKIFSSSTSEKKILLTSPIAGLQDGIFIVRVISGNESRNYKIVKTLHQ